MKPSRWVWLSLLCLVALGCSSEPGAEPDSGPLADAGETRDGSLIVPIDGSQPSEDADLADTGLDVADAGHIADDDAGDELDASMSMDASSETQDASMLVDGSIRGGSTCAEALDVTAGVHLTGESTVGATDDYAPSGRTCPRGAVSGPDRTYVVRPTVATMYRVVVTPSTAAFDPMLYAMRVCGGGCVAGTVFNGAGEPEEIEFSVEAGEVVYIIVDGELGTAGSYTLEVLPS